MPIVKKAGSFLKICLLVLFLIFLTVLSVDVIWYFSIAHPGQKISEKYYFQIYNLNRSQVFKFFYGDLFVKPLAKLFPKIKSELIYPLNNVPVKYHFQNGEVMNKLSGVVTSIKSSKGVYTISVQYKNKKIGDFIFRDNSLENITETDYFEQTGFRENYLVYDFTKSSIQNLKVGDKVTLFITDLKSQDILSIYKIP
jgi:hypothetical protein